MSKTKETQEVAVVEEVESSLYYFYTQGCGWCKKTEPIVDELIKEGYNILKLDLAVGDNQKLQNEVKSEYKHQCGTPYFVDGETGNSICGFREKDVLEKWANGEEIPQPVKPKGMPPKMPLFGASKQEEKAWKTEYNKWAKENKDLPNIKTAKEILSMPRPKSEPPKPPQLDASDADLQTWKESYDKWAKENGHLPSVMSSDTILERFKQRNNQQVPQQAVDNTKINSLEAKVTALEVKIDKIMSHFGVK